MEKVYDAESGVYLGLIWHDQFDDFGIVTIAEDRRARTATFHTDDAAREWLADQPASPEQAA